MEPGKVEEKRASGEKAKVDSIFGDELPLLPRFVNSATSGPPPVVPETALLTQEEPGHEGTVGFVSFTTFYVEPIFFPFVINYGPLSGRSFCAGVSRRLLAINANFI